MFRTSARYFAYSLIAATTGGAALWGCLPQETQGKGGNLAFAYSFSDAASGPGLSTPIAVGARMDLNVFQNDGDRTPVTVNSATAANGGIISVNGTDADEVTVLAEGAGTTELSVDTSQGTDAVDLFADTLDRVEVTLPRVLGDPEPTEIVFLQGGISRFGMTLFNAEGAELTGYGLEVVTAEPAGAIAQIDSKDIEHVRIQMNTAGDIRVIPTNGQEVSVTVVEPADVTEVVFANDTDDDPTNPLATISAGAETILFINAHLADTRRVIGLEGAYTLTTSTPDICSISPSADFAFFEQLTDGAIQVQGIAAGDCNVSVTLGTQTVETTVTVN